MLPSALTPFDQYVFAFLALIGTYVAAALLLWLAQISHFAPFIRSFRGIAHNFLTVINVIFALNLAFLANDTWEAHDAALNAVHREAGSLRSLQDLAGSLPEPSRSAVLDAVHAYAEETVATEWPLLGRRESSPLVQDRLDVLIALIASPVIAKAASSTVHAGLLDQAVRLRDVRDLRVSLSQTHVNPLKWLGMAFLGFLTMVSIAMVHVDNAKAQFLSVLLYATAAAPTAAIILVHGNPYQQPMAIASAPLLSVIDQERLEAVGAPIEPGLGPIAEGRPDLNLRSQSEPGRSAADARAEAETAGGG